VLLNRFFCCFPRRLCMVCLRFEWFCTGCVPSTIKRDWWCF